jgi:hypothetical protein
LPSALKRVDQGVTKVAIRHVGDNAVSLVTTDDGLLIIGPDPAGRLLELLGERRNGAMAQWPTHHLSRYALEGEESEVSTVTTKATKKSRKSLEEEWGMRMAEKVETKEWADKLAGDVDAGRVKVTTDPAEIQRLLRGPGRPALGSGPGSSTQVKVRVDSDLLELLDAYAERTNGSRSVVLREALRRFLRADAERSQ